MKKKDIKTIRDKEVKELHTHVRELRKQLIGVTPKMAIGEVKNLKEKRNLRTEIAQILGIIREKELKGENK